ncbi:MAG: 1,4-alpha-glucan branching protein GlgB [Oscillospiraceae bacterium]|nr:1,4-alpha-glucan branching protein GlgB [Oscillospiraceae bacterium]
MKIQETGRHWQRMGAHPCRVDDQDGWRFRVWAPNAVSVCVMGDFNDWDPDADPMEREENGEWERFLPGPAEGDLYQYAVHTADGRVLAKADPYAFQNEVRPGRASRLRCLDGYQWGDEAWMKWRAKHPVYDRPLNIYEVHLGSWRRTPEGEFLSYRDTARYLVPYVKEMGFTHVELLPVTEHPLDASWGYQCAGYFAPTSRYGDPFDLMYLIDQLHKAGIGVILDWVPAHFPKDSHGLYQFDGSPLYEYADPKKGEHKIWGTAAFDLEREEVRRFLIDSALFWLEEYHADGLRVDAVAAMLYLDYERQPGEWEPNVNGGRENLEGAEFLKILNATVFREHPDVLMAAEESTSWPMVTGPVHEGGLGFNLKWNMGWMNDVCQYLKTEPDLRKDNHKCLTFPLVYSFSENFVLPISHDEVVYLKGSLLNKMPGAAEEKYAGVRCFYTYMMTYPGKKLIMMGSEFGQWNEWNYEQSLDWHLLDLQDEDGERHRRLRHFFSEINTFYLDSPALWQLDFSRDGFRWICSDDADGNTIIYSRVDKRGRELIVAVNFSNVFRRGYQIGISRPGRYEEVFNSDLSEFGGQDRRNGVMRTRPDPCHGQPHSLTADIPPLGTIILKCTKPKSPGGSDKAGGQRPS